MASSHVGDASSSSKLKTLSVRVVGAAGFRCSPCSGDESVDVEQTDEDELLLGGLVVLCAGDSGGVVE